jgi:transcriptional regulator with XRE-family HTH domain
MNWQQVGKMHQALNLARDPGPVYNQHVQGVGAPRSGPAGLPLADLIAAEMARQGLTLKSVARLVRKSATAESDYSQVHEQLVSKWRSGQFIPNASHLRWLAHSLKLPVELLTAAAEAQRILRADVATRPVLLEGVPMDRELFANLRNVKSLNEATLDHLDAVADQYTQQIWIGPSKAILHGAWSQYVQLWTLVTKCPPANRSGRLKRQLGTMALVLGRLARHLDNRGDALSYWTTAEELGADIGDESLRAAALVDRTHYSSDSNALDLLEGAEKCLSPGSSAYLRAWLFTRKARILAASDMPATTYHQLESAARALGNAKNQPSGYFIGWSERWLASYEADCAIRLGRCQHGADLLEGLLASSDPAPYHRLALLRDLAVAYARQNEVERSCGSLSGAIDLPAMLQLSEQLRQLDQVRRRHLSQVAGGTSRPSA